MPIFMDRHDLAGLSPADVMAAHAQDLAAESRYGVKYLTYWFDYERQHTFCLVEAPSAEAAVMVHRDAHGDLPSEIRPVEIDEVAAFLGRTTDPPGKEPIAEPALRTIVFTDIVDSTRHHAELGDEAVMELLRRHDAVVREELARHSGREIKHTGDGFMAAFVSATDAVRFGVAVQGRFVRGDVDPLRIRVGINAGEPIAESDQLFGMAVNLASRLCDVAVPGAVVVSDVVRGLTIGKGFRYEDLGETALKGFPEPVRIFAVTA